MAAYLRLRDLIPLKNKIVLDVTKYSSSLILIMSQKTNYTDFNEELDGSLFREYYDEIFKKIPLILLTIVYVLNFSI